MTKTNKFKQNVALISFGLACFMVFAAIGATVALYRFEEEQESQPVEQTVVVYPLIAEPDRLDFGEVDEGTHEGVVYLTNPTDRTITLLFADSSCRCGVAKLPGNMILPGEKMPVKCTLSTAGRISSLVGGEIVIAYRFAELDEEERSISHVCSGYTQGGR